MAEQDLTVIAVEELSPAAVTGAVRELQEDGIENVALVGASAGADTILLLAAADPELGDQLILLSPNAVVEGLGVQPKLFIASEDEPVAHVSRRLAQTAAGRDNEVVLLPGSAHAQGIFGTDQGERTTTLILQRLEGLARHAAR